MYLLYSVFTAVGMLLLTPYFLIKGIRHKKYLQNLSQRFGLRFPTGLAAASNAAPGAIWVHAVSVGEALAATPFARALKARHPERRLLISTTTATGQALARERMRFADAVFYFPLDWSGPVRRTLHAARPAVAIIFETEIWPHFLREARRSGVPVLFVNGRISDRSFRRFTLAIRFSAGLLRGFLRRVLSDPTLFLMQTERDRARLVLLGAPSERVTVAGNMKYDLTPAAESPLVVWLAAEMARSGRGPLLVAGSVIAGEEAPVLEALSMVCRKWPSALLVMAPRKPDRFDAVRALIEQAGRRAISRSGIALADASSSQGALERSPADAGSVLLLDTIGELSAIYQLADAVFIGGSLEPAGGHNPLEPAAFGKAPTFGPSMENFQEIADEFLRSDAAVQVRSGRELGEAWTTLLGDEPRRKSMGGSARDAVERHRGATAAALEYVDALLTPPGSAWRGRNSRR